VQHGRDLECCGRRNAADDNACAQSTDCTAMLTCLNGCATNDTTCVNNCKSAHPSGTALLSTFFSCLSASCKTPCGL
jgi:hypothetical protein